MMRKRTLITLLLAVSVMNIWADERQHMVKPGDTLYSLSKKYGVTVEAIQAANPSIEGTNIPAGMVLVIPESTEETQKEEKKRGSLFSIFKKDKTDDKKAETPVVQEEVKQEELQAPVEEEKPLVRVKQHGAPDNIVVILPFNLNSQSMADDRQQMRAVEFYEGLLLAVNEAQQNGQKILVQTYDLGSKTMGEILATKSLLDADVIIAPMEQSEVRIVADFGRENNINVVSPFQFAQELSVNNKNLIQLNTSKTMLYDNLTEEVLKRFNDYEFVFLSDSAYASKPDPYADYLKRSLSARNVKYHNFSYLNPEKLAVVDSLLHIENHNILYVPVANNKESLRKMFPCLKCTTFEAGSDTKTGVTAILGYPEWVLYTSDFMDYYYDMNVYMFSKFYINPFDEEVRKFNTNFRYWFAKEPMQLSPRYATLGYDIGKYFLAAIRRYGPAFDEHLESFETETLQSMMSFRRDGLGFINKGLYLVHFTPSTQIEKYEIK